MKRYDLYWCLGGLALGLLIALTTLMEQGFAVNSFNAGRLTGNVLGDASQALASFDKTGHKGDGIIVSCKGLLRVDFSADFVFYRARSGAAG